MAGGPSTPASEDASGGRIVPVAIGLVAVFLLALLSRGTGDTSAASTGPATSSGSSPSDGGTGMPGASVTGSAVVTPAPGSDGSDSGGGGALTAGDRSMLDAAGSSDPAAALAELSGQPVSATDVEVLCVPADEGFWIGTSDSRRIWVQLIGDGESVYEVDPGDTVGFTGTLVAHDGTFAGTVGVAGAGGAAQLTAQAQHVEVAMAELTLSG